MSPMASKAAAQSRPDDSLPGIFCIEGEWSEDFRERLSVRPVLELLEHLKVAQWVHRDAATVPEFSYYLEKWASDSYREFGVLWLASHGDRALLSLNGSEDGSLGLDDLEKQLKNACAGRVIYFASCSMLTESDERLQKFVQRTGARAVIGYRKDIVWTEAAAFEIFLLQQLVMHVRSSGIFKRLVEDHPVLSRRLGLVIATKTAVHKTPLRRSSGDS